MSSTHVVTGAAGFIGSHLSRALAARGDAIVGVDNFDPFYDEDRKRRNAASVGGALTLLERDIRDEALSATLETASNQGRFGTFFHLAALAGVRPSIAEPARYASVNVDGLINILETARAAGCRHVVFASSSSVYGNNRKIPFSETDSVDEPISPYAATKRAGELICNTYAHLYGMTIASVRLFTVFGPSQRPDLAISKFMRCIVEGREVTMFGDGSTSRDYTFVDDIVAGILAAERWTKDQAQPTARIFNLGGSHPVTLREMIERIADVVGQPARIRQEPMQPGDVDRTYADLTRSTAELGYAPSTSFEEGLRHQWAWMQGSGLLETTPR